MLIDVIGSPFGASFGCPGDAPQKARMDLLQHQQQFCEELKRREKATERREWQEAARVGVASYDRAKASTRR